MKQQSPQNKIAVITCNIGGYDKILEHFFLDRDIDYLYFTDGNAVPKEWIHIKVTDEMFDSNDYSDVQKARLIKTNPYQYLEDPDKYEIIIWIDSNFEQKKTLKTLIAKMRGYELLIMSHPNRNCIYHECNACIEMGIGDQQTIKNHFIWLQNNNYPPAIGLAATGIMIRRTSDKTKEISRQWSEFIKKNLYRDQLSFDYVCWKNDFKYTTFPYGTRGEWLYHHLHLGKRK